MNTISFVLFCVLCLGTGALSVMLLNSRAILSAGAKAVAFFAITALAVVCANLKELNNVLTIFIPLALAILMIGETLENFAEKKDVVSAIFTTISTVMLAIAPIMFAGFYYLALIGGILLGFGVGVVVISTKRYRGVQPILMTILKYMAMCVFFAFSLVGLVFGNHLLSALTLLISSLLILTHELLKTYIKSNKIQYVAYSIKIIAYILVSLAIFLF